MSRQDEEWQIDQAKQLKDLLEEVGRRSVTAISPDGLIKVSAVATGQIVGLEIDPRIYRHANSLGLARSILDTLNEAISRANDIHLDSLARTSGVAADTFQQLFQNVNDLAAELLDEIDDSGNSR